MKRFLLVIVILVAAGLITTWVQAAVGYIPIPQSAQMWNYEAQVIYLSNLEREKAGVAPMRANAELNNAARWFAWDSIVNRPAGFCDHVDTLGNTADIRALAFGYLGYSGAEDAYCAYVTPELAVKGWMESEKHRENLLDPNTREAGAGYNWPGIDWHGYVVFDFGADPIYPPVIIDNEALDTQDSTVQLYIYDRSPVDSFKGQGAAVEMQVSNDACFRSANWEPYNARKTWTLAPGGDGWRTVYVRTRDTLGRVRSASDQIYLGRTFSPDLISADQFSSTRADAPLVGLDSGGLPLMQFSPGWIADDTTSTFQNLSGSGQQVSDAAAWGGTAYRLDAAGTSAWLWTTDFYKNQPMTAYLRIKVDDNRSSAEVARFSITGGNELVLKGTDFHSPGQYQEFAIPFTFPQQEEFLILKFSRSASTTVYFDAVTFFSAPVPYQEAYHWMLPDGNYRGQGIWVRNTDGAGHFSPFTLASTVKQDLSVHPDAVYLMAAHDHSTPEQATLRVSETCLETDWQVLSDAPWVEVWPDGNQIQVRVYPDQLANGRYQSNIRVITGDGSREIDVPVSLQVVDHANPLFFPISN